MSSIVYHNPDIRFTYYLIIPHAMPGDFRVLLQQQDDATWTLPFYEPDEHHFGVVHHINRHMWDNHGLALSTLRCLQTHYTPQQGEQRFYAMDNLHPSWRPPSGMRWFTEKDVREAALASDLQRDMLKLWYVWRHSDSSLRAPWTRQGWFPWVASWMIDLADRMAMEGLHAVEQVRAWSRSCTMRLRTDMGTLYLKAVPEMFNYEPVITRVIAIRYPGTAPDVRAVHVENGWMLMRDFGGVPLNRVSDIDVWKRVVRRFAHLQLDLVMNTQSLVGLGVPDRNVDYLASQIPRLMNDLPDTLADDEQEELQRIAPTLRELCFELLEHPVPLSLTHGDLWAGNVIVTDDGGSLFFDWSDASISHPFFDLPFFLSEIERELPLIPDAREQLRDAYLEVWTRFEPLSDLQRAYELAQVLSGLHQALFYHVHILPSIEATARWEMQNMLPMLLRQVVAALRLFRR